MASYALPPSPLGHNHHGHVHSNSRAHTHSPSLSPPPPRRSGAVERAYGANVPRPLHQTKSAGALHTHSHSELHAYNHERYKINSDMSPYQNGYANGAGGLARNNYPRSPTMSNFGSETSSHHHDDHNHSHSHGHDHSHNHKHEGSHSSSSLVESKSRFTNFILSRTQNSPLLHTIMLEKDSRRIFYFMRYIFPYFYSQCAWEEEITDRN